MTGREFKDITFQQFANIANAFSSPKRLEIIDVLSQGERDVESLVKQTNMSFANTSRHLQILKNSHLIKSRKEGVRVYYSLADREVYNCWRSLQSLAEKTTAEIREVTRLFFDERLALEPISMTELSERLEKGNITLIDVRPKEEYESGHIRKAVGATLDNIKSGKLNFPKSKKIVAYCRGKYCVLAAEAAKYLNSKGYKVTIMKEDINSWQESGLPVEK
ncbi:MAG: metalloregulator ArsR/SmtB family transcription factor [Melioribacteraceae bacterium]|nr:metalloregulator ArsR/SmtB family transcription factor [Melioribacteraceae bacterium]MCF8393379.1 metalloregulator ArsR/SmtB family transcription factor [Melioribacteraceae bacterium]MCF8418944.1 metalloregulator ArsR/SmtB family transcription factor [Melioribacteraceae bacterium]